MRLATRLLAEKTPSNGRLNFHGFQAVEEGLVIGCFFALV
jgi:hypothetical protein